MQLHKSEILIIVAIIAASYLFSMDEVKFLDTQLMFILLTLGIVIIYKLMYIQKMKNMNVKENFYNKVSLPSSGLDEIYRQNSSTEDNYVTRVDYDNLLNKFNDLQKEISIKLQRGGLETTRRNNIKELINDSDDIDKKIRKRRNDIDELKSMLVNKVNEDNEDINKVVINDSHIVNKDNEIDNNNSNDIINDGNRLNQPVSNFRNTNNFMNTLNKIPIKSSFKNMISDADGGVTEFKNTGKHNYSNKGISKSNMKNTQGNSGNQQNKSQISKLIDQITKNGIEINL